MTLQSQPVQRLRCQSQEQHMSSQQLKTALSNIELHTQHQHINEPCLILIHVCAHAHRCMCVSVIEAGYHTFPISQCTVAHMERFC